MGVTQTFNTGRPEPLVASPSADCSCCNCLLIVITEYGDNETQRISRSLSSRQSSLPPLCSSIGVLHGNHYFANKGSYSQSYSFSVIMYGCESWTIRKAEHQRIDAFELWCWKRLLRVPWTAWRSNQSILKEINPEYSMEGLMLKLQYLDHLMRRTDSLKKALMLGKIEGRRRRG